MKTTPEIYKTCWSFGIYVYIKPLTGSKVCIEILKNNVFKAGTKIYNQKSKEDYNALNIKISQLYHDFYYKIVQKFDKKTINLKLKDYAARNQSA